MTDEITSKPAAPAIPEKKERKKRVIKSELRKPLRSEPPISSAGSETPTRRRRKRLPIKEVPRETTIEGMKMIVTVFSATLGQTEQFFPTKKAATKALREFQKTHKPRKSRRLKTAIALKKRWVSIPPEKDAPEDLLDLGKEVESVLIQYIDGAKTRGYVS